MTADFDSVVFLTAKNVAFFRNDRDSGRTFSRCRRAENRIEIMKTTQNLPEHSRPR